MHAHEPVGQRVLKVISEAEWEMIGQRLDISDRWLELIRAIVAGHEKPEAIAAVMGLRRSTVKTHIQRMYRKIGVRSKVEVILCVFLTLFEVRDRPSPGQRDAD